MIEKLLACTLAAVFIDCGMWFVKVSISMERGSDALDTGAIGFMLILFGLCLARSIEVIVYPE